jgi:hypothetical protein
LRTAEDVYVDVASYAGGRSLGAVVGALVDAGGLERALSVYAARRGPLRAAMGVRVVARVQSERAFHRTARDALLRQVLRARPRWYAADPADVELWAIEVPSGEWRLALRLTTGDLPPRRSHARAAGRAAAHRGRGHGPAGRCSSRP